MANTYTSLFYHIVFSTKNRVAFIRPDIEERVWAYISGIARNHKMTALKIGGVEDHLHALIMAPPAIAPYEIAKYLKGESSKWIHETFADLRDFGWQDGYGAFTVSKSKLPDVVSYIQKQRMHHQAQTFQDEYREMLDKHGVEYDEQYLWG
jgi:REP element-mobilizing transposase RayT